MGVSEAQVFQLCEIGKEVCGNLCERVAIESLVERDGKSGNRERGKRSRNKAQYLKICEAREGACRDGRDGVVVERS